MHGKINRQNRRFVRQALQNFSGSRRQHVAVKNLLDIVAEIETEYDEGAPVDVVVERAEEVGVEPGKAEHEIKKLKQKGEVYEPRTDHLRTT